MCVTFLGRFYQSLKDNDVEFTPSSIEKELLKSCKEAKGKENRLCYYIGATSDAATKIINEVSKPMSHHIPVEKICEKLKKKDSQICELKYVEKKCCCSCNKGALRPIVELLHRNCNQAFCLLIIFSIKSLICCPNLT